MVRTAWDPQDPFSESKAKQKQHEQQKQTKSEFHLENGKRNLEEFRIQISQ